MDVLDPEPARHFFAHFEAWKHRLPILQESGGVRLQHISAASDKAIASESWLDYKMEDGLLSIGCKCCSKTPAAESGSSLARSFATYKVHDVL